MSFSDFQHFFLVLQPDLVRVMTRSTRTNAPNGIVPLKSRLAIAIRYFSGGCPYDISVVYEVSHSVVLESVDYVIDAVNSSECDWLKLEYPEDHDDQKDIAQGSKARSAAGFGNCAGCIDGMLVWIHKPSDTECDRTGVDSAKYFCGRKHKYGLNLQAICDVNRKFLEISIKWGGSASDLVAFETSSLASKLDTTGFLHPDLCLFGDNAYVNKPTMATPYPNNNTYTVDKDNYNFFHSQVRIAIECAFGILLQRFALLRRKLPQQFTIRKTMALVSCLCRVHNFLIERRLQQNPNVDHENVPDLLAQDELELVVDGAALLRREGNEAAAPEQLLGGGEHFDDDPARSFRRARRYHPEQLPREKMLRHVINNNLVRPARSRSRV